ncbi:hypothetical protein OIM90_18030 [Streptomyces sp. AD16]|nr:hypothetical protein OIM90_18030 [Streptomyces sp. AD16]
MTMTSSDGSGERRARQPSRQLHGAPAPGRRLLRGTEPAPESARGAVRRPGAPGRAEAPEVHRERRRYRALLLPATAVLTAVSLGLGALTDSALVGSVAALVLCGVAAVLWLRAHQALTRAKEEGGWYEELRQGVAMDTSLRTDPVRMPWLWVVPSLLVLAVSATAGAFAYPELPDTLWLPERSPPAPPTARSPPPSGRPSAWSSPSSRSPSPWSARSPRSCGPVPTWTPPGPAPARPSTAAGSS